MKHRFLLIVICSLTFFCSPEKKENQETLESVAKIKSTDSIRTEVDYYAESLIYRDANSDSLIIGSNDLIDLINSFKQTGKLITAKKYGGGDYSGKFRIFSEGSDTLIVDKNNSGEYGFGNAQYLIRKDSLKYVRKYRLESDYGYNKHLIKENIFKFYNGRVVLLERSKTIVGLNDFRLDGIPLIDPLFSQTNLLHNFLSGNVIVPEIR